MFLGPFCFFVCVSYVINSIAASLQPLCLHLDEVKAAFHAWKQHPQWLFESAYRRPLLIDFPMNTSCPPFRSRFPPFLIPAEQSHDRRCPLREGRKLAVMFARPAGNDVCLCKRKTRKVWGRGRRPVGHPGLKGIIGITLVKLLFFFNKVSCILFCLHFPAPWSQLIIRKLFFFALLFVQD